MFAVLVGGRSTLLFILFLIRYVDGIGRLAFFRGIIIPMHEWRDGVEGPRLNLETNPENVYHPLATSPYHHLVIIKHDLPQVLLTRIRVCPLNHGHPECKQYVFLM